MVFLDFSHKWRFIAVYKRISNE